MRLARERRGFTKAALAEALGVTSASISRYEVSGVPREMLHDLGRVLRVPPSSLQRESVDDVEQQSVQFRALSRATNRQRRAACAVGVSGIELYEWLSTRFRLPGVVLPELDGESPEDAAAAVRPALGVGGGPLPNFIQLSEAHGIRVLSLPPIAAAVDAFSLWRNGSPYVFLSTMKSAERSRFDLAHEIGHLVLHSRGHLGDLEREADEFAAALLVPAEQLRARVGREVAVPALLRLRRTYGVSAMAMLRRLRDLELISADTYRQDCVFLAQRGFRRSEPDGLPRERSRVFQFTFDHLRSTADGLALLVDDLGLPLDDLHEMTFGQYLRVVPGSGSERTRERASLRAV